MKKLLLGLLLAISLTAHAGIPTLKITAGSTVLRKDAETLVIITASEPIANLTLSDLNIQGNGIFTTALVADTATTYSVGFKKTVDTQSASIIVDNKSYTAISDGGLGVYAQIGFNPMTEYYVEQGNNFLLSKVRAEPQPIALKVGEILVNSADNSPATKAFERYYTIFKNSFKAVNDPTLFRLQAGQKVIPKPNPTLAETRNPQGAHNHDQLAPKANYIDVRTTGGLSRPRVAASNECAANAEGKYICLGDPAPMDGGGGDFRMTMDFSHVNADDPIVFPNQQGRAHTHCYFANRSVNFQTTAASLLFSSVTTAVGGKINRSAYWAPCVIDTATNTVLTPASGNFYYKSFAPIDMTEPIPQGLKGIAGNPAGTSAATRKDDTRYNCNPRQGSTLPYLTSYGVMPECSGKDYDDLNLFVPFQSCLADDGGKIKLDSPDHRSHWRPWNDPTANNLPNGCTTAYPHRITHLTQNIHYTIPPNANTKTWRLSSDNYTAGMVSGASLHADYWAMWSETPYNWMRRLTEECNNTGGNCGQNYIGMNDGITIASITTVGTTATVTTTNPHQLDTPGAMFNGGVKLRVRITGVSGADASAYNVNRSLVENPRSLTTPKKLLPFGVQPITITGPNTFTYTLNSTPTDTEKTGAELTGALVRWGEILSTDKDSPYSEYYYGGN